MREREGERERESLPKLVVRLLDFSGNLLPVLGTELSVSKLTNSRHIAHHSILTGLSLLTFTVSTAETVLARYRPCSGSSSSS